MRVMKNLLFPAVLLAGSISSSPVVQGVGPADHGDCAQLTQLKLADAKLTEAIAVPAGTGVIKVAHCKVSGVIGKEIRFALLLPDAWNRKFLMGGGGGFVGSIDNQALASVNAGYATVGTDTGHQDRKSVV